MSDFPLYIAILYKRVDCALSEFRLRRNSDRDFDASEFRQILDPGRPDGGGTGRHEQALGSQLGNVFVMPSAAEVVFCLKLLACSLQKPKLAQKPPHANPKLRSGGPAS